MLVGFAINIPYLILLLTFVQKLKEENAAIQEEYGFCIMDGHKEKIGNFRIEPPGLFRGRGEHPKQGMLKRRVLPEDVIINCSKYVGKKLCFVIELVPSC